MMIDLTFLKELMSIKQVNQKSVIFVTIGTFLDKRFKFHQMFATGAMMQ